MSDIHASQSQSQTELSQCELEEITSPRFIAKSLGPGTLSTRLQTIASVLPRIDQDDDDRIGELRTLVDALGEKWILKQKNNEIELLLACIHSDILRIYAPEQPYSDDNTLTKIFEIMIASLDGVQNPDHEDYDFHFRVLESLSTVQSYIVMNDLENESLLMFLTKQLFKITTEKTVKLSLNHITDILCGLINDIQVIPETFLQFILERLIEPLRSRHPTEYDLASTVIRRCTDDLKLAIDEYIANTIANMENNEENNENKKKKKQIAQNRKQQRMKLSIITELASISADFLDNSMLKLEECLQNEDLQIRLLFVDMFASIFTQSSPSLSRQWTPLFRVFLKRYDDVSIEIREFMANITCLLFQTQHFFRREIQEFCIKRIEDINERIRREITKQVCIASMQSSSNAPTSIISLALFDKLLQRTLDKKASVRYIAIEYCSKLFAQHLCPYWRNNKALPSEMRALLPIPKKLISILNSIDFSTKLHLESIFDKEIIGNQIEIEIEIEKRMNVTLGIIALLSEESKQLFLKYFMREKYQLQTLIQKILSTHDEIRIMHDNEDDNTQNTPIMQRQYEISYSNFNQRFPIYTKPKASDPKPSDLLKQLIENKNGKIRHYLQCLCTISTTLTSTYNCCNNLLSLTKANTALHEFTTSLCIRLSNVLFCCDGIPVLLDKMLDIVEHHNAQPRALLHSAIFILNSLCDDCPDIFDDHQCLQQWMKLFNLPKTIAPSSIDIAQRLSFVSLRILAKSVTPNSFDVDDGVSLDFWKDLTEKARASASHKEAQLATQCLIKCHGKYSPIINTLCDETSTELDITQQYLPSLLSTLAIIAKLSPNIFISRANLIIPFILDTLLPYDLNETPMLWISAQCGIRILVNYLLSMVDLPHDQLGIQSSPMMEPMVEPMSEPMMEDADPFSNDNHTTLQQPISPEIECDRILDALFELIQKYAQINCNKESNEKAKVKRHDMSTDEVSLVNVAVDAILDIIRPHRYRRLLRLLRFYELGFLIHHKNANIRKHTLQSFWNRLRDHKLPSHYSCIFPLIATDPDKRLRDTYRPAVQRYFDRMRKESEIRTSSSVSLSLNPVQISKLPEYLLFYVIHLLAHHPDFDEKSMKKELKSPAFVDSASIETSCFDYFGAILDFYFDTLLKGNHCNKFPLIIKILTKIDESFDVFSPLSKGHRYLLRCAMKKLKKRYKNKEFQDFPGRIPLPKIIFKLRESHYDSEKTHKTSPRRVKSKSFQKKYGDLHPHESDHPSDEDIMKDMQNINVSALNISTIRRNLNESLIDTKDDKKDEKDIDDDDEKATLKSKRKTKKQRNVRKKRKREDMGNDTGDSDEEEPPKKKQKRRGLRNKRS